MDKTYQPKQIENKYRAFWNLNNFFSAEYQKNAKQSYAIMLPPPNITGSLHMGHAFQHTIMDILVRYHRMCGKQTLWQTGTDHAGIATQMVVEGMLSAKGENKHDLGRDKFIQRIWAWKENSGGRITEQMRRLGVSVDWSRERFTMDEGLSRAVNKVFIQLFEEGLIYRGKRLVNWDPVLQTALSDLEVVSKEENGFMHHVHYPFVDDDGFMEIATTRPETILADGALAVNPTDGRYKNLVGKWVWVPMTDRKIPIIADEYVAIDFGTGCVKITPAHDFNDWEVGKRHKMEIINLFTPDAKMNKNTPKAYWGLDRFKAREKILKDLADAGLLVKIEDHKLTLPRGDRSGAILEPYLTNQWFVKTLPLAKPAIDAVKNGTIRFVPSNWQKTYFNWLENIDDWCISRQIWWGHRIPAWYDSHGKVYVGFDEISVRKEYNLSDDIVLQQDEDVLDTWFSSALWPFSTLGWPEKTKAFKRFYPTDVLVTGFDIIFFWVARMIMFGLKFAGDIPFKDIYMTGLIRDSHGKKMSKSKGNILDPIDLIDGISLQELIKKRTRNLMQPRMKNNIIKATRREFPDGIAAFGADALRFTFAALASFGRDINFDLKRAYGYRNFCNKLWNAARFILMQTNADLLHEKAYEKTNIDKWIIARLESLKQNVHKHLANYRIDLMAQALYDFVWHDYCDWYLEFAKYLLNKDKTAAATTQTLFHTLSKILALLNPIIPFITEEIYAELLVKMQKENLSKRSLAEMSYPKFNKNAIDKNVETEIIWLQQFILGVRQIRGEMNIAPNKKLICFVTNYSQKEKQYFYSYCAIILQLAKLEDITLFSENMDTPESAVALVGEMKILIPLANIIDKNQELLRLKKEVAKLNKQKIILDNKLANKKFLTRAPKYIVMNEREKLQKIDKAITNLNTQSDKITTL